MSERLVSDWLVSDKLVSDLLASDWLVSDKLVSDRRSGATAWANSRRVGSHRRRESA